ncbi:MAG TPA: chemotaxis protein CheW [Solirubrobacteraceae bacterium]|jgi:purine-binding chemotaxis protein CheW|nr:chemotaxis protein CheW [Solirubrobacteraceae bacterium]
MSQQANQQQLVVFTLGAEHYALPIHAVNEIIRYAEPRSVASRSDWVRGVISLRGRIVPVYDVATRLGLTSQLTEQSKIVIVEAGAETAGVIVDSVEEVLTVSDDQIEEAPGADSTMIEAIIRIDDRLVVLLTLNTIFVTSPDLTAAA